MPYLIADYIVCLDEEDNVGSDDLYLIVFRGDTIAPFNSNVKVFGPGDFWDDFDAGESRGQDIYVASYRSDSVYVVMLVERDDSKDIDSEVLGAYRTATGLVWKSQMLSLLAGGAGPASDNQRTAAANAISGTMSGLASIYMEFPKGNDDPLGGPQRINLKPGHVQSYLFATGDDGLYMVNFKVAA